MKPCYRQKGEKNCENNNQNYREVVNSKGANETVLDNKNEYISYNQDNFTRKYKMNRGGKHIFKRDIEGKENDPWSIISPVGKYQIDIRCSSHVSSLFSIIWLINFARLFLASVNYKNIFVSNSKETLAWRAFQSVVFGSKHIL